MKRVIIAFLLFSAALPGEETQLATEFGLHQLAVGCVDIITGRLVLPETDCNVLRTLCTHRIYDSSSNNVKSPIGCGFALNFPQTIQWVNQDRAGCCHAQLELWDGMSLHCCGRYQGGKGVYTTHIGTRKLPHIQVQHRNSRNEFSGGQWEVALGCGTKRIYTPRPGSARIFDLAEEQRPNGNRVLFQYNKARQLVRAFLTDHNKKTPLIDYSITFEDNKITTWGSNRQITAYVVHPKTNLLLEVQGEHLVDTKYDYLEGMCDGQLCNKLVGVFRPNGRTLKISYSPDLKRVAALSGPVGDDVSLHDFALFSYPHEGACTVVGPCQEFTQYLFNPQNHCLSHLQRWSQGTLHHQTRYFWGSAESASDLKANVLCDANGNAVRATTFDYDDHHHVTRETLLGNLSGRGPSSFTFDEQGKPTSAVESYGITRTHHPVYGVILTERGDDGLFTEYRYNHGSNRLRQKLVGGDVRVSREFFEWDQYGNLTRHVVDNGTGHVDYLENVTVRTILEIEPIVKPLSPAFGKPYKRTEKYWENGQEHVLRTVCYEYDGRGHPSREEHYDAAGRHRYTIRRTYDAAGRVIEESDPLGETTSYIYDDNGNCILKILNKQHIHFEYLYDYSNRLIKEIEVHPHARYKTTHRYDHSSRRVATIDRYGHETLFFYDDLGRLIAKQDNNGVERFEYDIAGNQTAVHDVLGRITRTTYTARGQPVQISYPDGTQECYQYNGNGSLARHTAQDGSFTEMYYDKYLRPTRKCFYNPHGTYLYDIVTNYHGAQKISETDIYGVTTHYSYDGAGRLVEKNTANLRIQYAYNPLGYQYKTTEWHSDGSFTCTTREYDNLGRILSEKTDRQPPSL